MRAAELASVDVWTVALDEPGPAVISDGEQAQAARFHFERDRVRWTKARSALRLVLAKFVERNPLDLHFITGPYGKPALPEGRVHFNLSHSDAWGMIAVTRKTPVGIDIERVRGDVEIARLLRRIGEIDSSGSTHGLFRTWARREAKTKALGGPLMEVPLGDLRVADLEAPDGFVAALAVVGCDPRIEYRRFRDL